MSTSRELAAPRSTSQAVAYPTAATQRWVDTGGKFAHTSRTVHLETGVTYSDSCAFPRPSADIDDVQDVPSQTRLAEQLSFPVYGDTISDVEMVDVFDAWTESTMHTVTMRTASERENGNDGRDSQYSCMSVDEDDARSLFSGSSTATPTTRGSAGSGWHQVILDRMHTGHRVDEEDGDGEEEAEVEQILLGGAKQDPEDTAEREEVEEKRAEEEVNEQEATSGKSFGTFSSISPSLPPDPSPQRRSSRIGPLRRNENRGRQTARRGSLLRSRHLQSRRESSPEC